MKTAFFPFTVLSRPVLTTLRTLFGAVTVYQPLSDAVPEALKNLQSQAAWALQPNESHIFQIRDEIRRRARGKAFGAATDPLLTARLFLLLAQDYDSRHLEMTRDLVRLQESENRLFDALRAEAHPAAADPVKISDEHPAPAAIRVPERLRAWSRLMLEDDPRPVMFVTTCREAFEIIVDDTPAAALVSGSDAESGPLKTSGGRHPLMSYLQTLALSEWSSEKARGFNISAGSSLHRIRLTLAIVPDTPAGAVFARYAGDTPVGSRNDRTYRHTLLALVE